MPRKEEAIWNRFSTIYDRIMKKDEAAYEEIIKRIAMLMGPENRILEIATGTGIIALGLADRIWSIEAVDLSPDMLAVAKKKAHRLGVSNVEFSIQDACNLKYASSSFDSVIIANTLHIIPEPEKAMEEIKRVLKPEGRLIAPTFMHSGSIKVGILSKLMLLTGFRAYHKWTQQSYHTFLGENGFAVVDSIMIKASFPIAYVVAKKDI